MTNRENALVLIVEFISLIGPLPNALLISRIGIQGDTLVTSVSLVTAQIQLSSYALFKIGIDVPFSRIDYHGRDKIL